MNLSIASLTLGVLSLAAFASPAFAQSTVTAADRAFLMKASQANIGEIASGKLAEQKGVSADTRLLGKRFVDNHSDNQRKLSALAKSLNVMLPMHPSADDMMVMAKLKGLTGEAFDSAFLAAEQKDHMKNIAAFKQEASTAQNPMIIAYTKASIPVLEEHLMVATDDAAKLRHAGSMSDAGGMKSGSFSSGMSGGMPQNGGANATTTNPVSGGQPNTPASNGSGRMGASGSGATNPGTAPAVSGGQPSTPASNGTGTTGTSGAATGSTGSSGAGASPTHSVSPANGGQPGTPASNGSGSTGASGTGARTNGTTPQSSTTTPTH